MHDDPIPYGYCQCGCGRKTGIAARTRPERGLVKGQPVRFCVGHAGRGDHPPYEGDGLCECGCGKKTSLAPQTNRAKGWVLGQPVRFVQGHGKQLPRPLAALLWEKVDVSSGPNACWPWTGRVRVGAGYGRLGAPGKLAHRVAWEDANGPIPPGLHVLHRCDNPPCCNPAHLFLGTHQDNMRDMLVKGRRARGSRIYASKLSEEDVREIRAKVDAGNSQAAVSREYGVTRACVSNIVHRVSWQHVA